MDMEFIQFIIGIHQVILFTPPPCTTISRLESLNLEFISYTRLVLLYGFFQFSRWYFLSGSTKSEHIVINLK